MEYKFDCRYFNGEKPCKYKRLCPECPHYSKYGTRILIIKLGAMGDVLRTTPILSALKEKYPENHITWITDPVAFDLLKNNSLIDRLLQYAPEALCRFDIEKFDLLISLDKEPRAIALAEKVQAVSKVGFGMNEYGAVRSFNTESAYAFALGLSDSLKFRENKKSYQEIIFELIGHPYQRQEYISSPGPKEKEFAETLIKKMDLGEGSIIIGISPGAGKVFAKKAWKIDRYIQLIDRINQEMGETTKVLLLGGKSEVEINRKIKKGLLTEIFDSGNENSLARFIAIVDQCDIVISGDTLAMHLAIGLKKQALTMFGPTCHQEIDLYGRGEKIVSRIECAPCYKGNCDIEDDCMSKISVEEVYKHLCGIVSLVGGKAGDSYQGAGCRKEKIHVPACPG